MDFLRGRERNLMNFKKSVRILTAGILSAFVLVATGAVGSDADTVEAAGGNMAVQAAISGSNVNVTASATSAPASDDGMLYLFAEPIYSDVFHTAER